MLKSLDGKRRSSDQLCVVVALTAIIATPALAITNGDLDGNNPPYVGLMVAQDAAGNPLWRCSGTLMSATVFLTAGHCTAPDPATGENPERAQIWFDTDVESGRPGNGYSFVGNVGGVPYTNPGWMPEAFFVRDAGVVILDTPYPMAQYGALPTTANAFDAWKTKRGRAKVTFDSVGYGLQESFPAQVGKTVAIRQRMIAHPKLNQINGGIVGDFSLLLSNNSHTGGTCFGDSGGPNFLAGSNTVAAVTSFGLNGNCAGTGGVLRMDRSWSLSFINDALTNGAGLSHYSGDPATIIGEGPSRKGGPSSYAVHRL